ncbi:MAG: hypothetical protein UW68_C0040G0012 [Candidatus Collierbacteria bacterium GW2011_GWB1_44_6]|uniref:Uncharacterized protein n=2 Tax=Candidatus Collieribacteriota TaxID=1752725 RepID=A0A0G1JLT9_9BACT|nr:MAG: hypothetical protein UV68_C0002G0004 [Candidatus Collierbacteria bacterium GW2011_GWC2_43_12]KKT72330.1 MAG: hypothetical protein UW68_C0040G0012 [Candidatus Collierbacteria bacterium GW2011_GWB1_44_6]KKT81345.1 MAG: hypothetical protein UW80_C0053G0004 [Microgenomates group bacterium GW2011_GWC1_44_9]
MDDTKTNNQTPLPEGTNAAVTSLYAIENLIKTHISHIESVKIELQKQAEMFNDILANDEKFKKANDEGKEIAKKKAEAKQDILKSPSNASLNQKIKDMRQELKELKGALSNYLQQYQKIADTDQIESEDGEVRQIVYSARLVKLTGHFSK